MVGISVADQGPGIPEESRERIFDRFYRLDESRNSDTGGAGLGLAITKWAVEAHEGIVDVSSTASGGALFRMVLPVISTNASHSFVASSQDPGRA
jgi:signal transduction histidine kinase